MQRPIFGKVITNAKMGNKQVDWAEILEKGTRC